MESADGPAPVFAELLTGFGVSMVVTTGRSGRLVLVRADDRGLETRLLAFESPMGVAVRPDRLCLGTRRQVFDYRNQPAVAARLDRPRGVDACYVPRGAHWTGDIGARDLAWAGDELWLVATSFSCLATLDADHSFRPRWRPPFVSALAPEDRCHLNGIAVRGGRVRYATALGRTDTAEGWRQRALRGGTLLDVPGGEVLAGGLCLPHSPRWHDGQLWVLEAGRGSLTLVDPDSGWPTVVATVPGFARGLAFAGRYAFIGLSPVRDGAPDGLPVAWTADRACGVAVVDTRSGETVTRLRLEGPVEEVEDVQLVPARYPEILEPDSPLTASSFVLPTEALADVPPPIAPR
ncbi:TIGR03032 family protein [Blastococcus montanus]|uniref:TIGR03032 family protein n=1 Tax=Blastococcus montanus TaxID=3144973 RepID=UPI00320A9DDC